MNETALVPAQRALLRELQHVLLGYVVQAYAENENDGITVGWAAVRLDGRWTRPEIRVALNDLVERGVLEGMPLGGYTLSDRAVAALARLG